MYVVQSLRDLADELEANDVDVDGTKLTDLLIFARAYVCLGDAVTEQLDDLIANGDQADVNPNAVSLIAEKLGILHPAIKELCDEWLDMAKYVADTAISLPAEAPATIAADYPAWVCRDCGKLYGKHPPAAQSTWHPSACGVCGLPEMVTEPRDFGHLKDGWQSHK